MPLLLLGGLLSVGDERLLEIPIVLLGVAWMVLGYAIAELRQQAEPAEAARDDD